MVIKKALPHDDVLERHHAAVKFHDKTAICKAIKKPSILHTKGCDGCAR